jgi:hypothetical protein
MSNPDHEAVEGAQRRPEYTVPLTIQLVDGVVNPNQYARRRARVVGSEPPGALIVSVWRDVLDFVRDSRDASKAGSSEARVSGGRE